MTAPAKITQADMERAAKATKAAGFSNAKIVIDLLHSKIEILVGQEASLTEPNPFDED